MIDPALLHLTFSSKRRNGYKGVRPRITRTSRKVKVLGPPATFSESEVRIQGASPLWREHKREILTGLLGYSDERVKAL